MIKTSKCKTLLFSAIHFEIIISNACKICMQFQNHTDSSHTIIQILIFRFKAICREKSSTNDVLHYQKENIKLRIWPFLMIDKLWKTNFEMQLRKKIMENIKIVYFKVLYFNSGLLLSKSSYLTKHFIIIVIIQCSITIY